MGVMRYLALVLLIFSLCAACYDHEQTSARFAAKTVNNCARTLTYANHKGNNGWCLASCTDGIYPETFYVLVVPCPTAENGK